MSPPRPAVSDAELCAFLDLETSSWRRAEIEAWLALHPDCAARLAGWRGHQRLLHAAFDGIAREPLPDFLTAPLPEKRVAPFPHAIAAQKDKWPSEETTPRADPGAGRQSFGGQSLGRQSLGGRRLGGLLALALILVALAGLIGLMASSLPQRFAKNAPLYETR
jgi:anti-sigma factor RsiW